MAIVSVIVDLNASDSELNRCIESLNAQTLDDFELIKAARNDGLSRASGKYVHFMRGDGMLFDNALELLVNAAEKSGAEIIHANSYVERKGEDVEVVAADMYSSACLNLYRREFLERNRLKFPVTSDGDEAFCYAAACLADKLECIDEPIYVGSLRAEVVDDEQTYVEDINRDEIRCGFLVTSQRKKLWNAQIKLIHEFARICRKYNLKWLTQAGTTLGAVRHKGFIPWDDDVDLVMLRDDFETFKEVAPKELKPQYFLDIPYNYAIEGEPNEENLPVISRELVAKIRAKGWNWPTIADFVKLRDNTAAQIQWPERRNVHQGIWIDIFVFDPAPPFDDNQRYIEYGIKRELLLAVSFPDVIEAAIENGEEFILAADILKNMLKLPYKQRALMYNDYLKKTYFKSKYVVRLNSRFLLDRQRKLESRFFDDVLWLPFEKTKLRVSAEYDFWLSGTFGNWRELIFKKSHVSSVTVDMSYKEFFEQVSPEIKEFNF